MTIEIAAPPRESADAIPDDEGSREEIAEPLIPFVARISTASTR